MSPPLPHRDPRSSIAPPTSSEVRSRRLHAWRRSGLEVLRPPRRPLALTRRRHVIPSLQGGTGSPVRERGTGNRSLGPRLGEEVPGEARTPPTLSPSPHDVEGGVSLTSPRGDIDPELAPRVLGDPHRRWFHRALPSASPVELLSCGGRKDQAMAAMENRCPLRKPPTRPDAEGSTTSTRIGIRTPGRADPVMRGLRRGGLARRRKKIARASTGKCGSLSPHTDTMVSAFTTITGRIDCPASILAAVGPEASSWSPGSPGPPLDHGRPSDPAAPRPERIWPEAAARPFPVPGTPMRIVPIGRPSDDLLAGQMPSGRKKSCRALHPCYVLPNG